MPNLIRNPLANIALWAQKQRHDFARSFQMLSKNINILFIRLFVCQLWECRISPTIPHSVLVSMATISAHIFHLGWCPWMSTLINVWFLLAMRAFYCLECRHSLYLVVVIARALLRWTNGNTSLTVCEWYVRDTLQEAVLSPFASLRELSYSEV